MLVSFEQGTILLRCGKSTGLLRQQKGTLRETFSEKERE
jgi:hypothetical protein